MITFSKPSTLAHPEAKYTPEDIQNCNIGDVLILKNGKRREIIIRKPHIIVVSSLVGRKESTFIPGDLYHRVREIIKIG